MVELPSELAAGREDRAEAETIVARIGGVDSVATALATDLAAGVAGRDVVITASGDIGHLVTANWATTIGSAGVRVHEASGQFGADVARIHLHSQPVAGSGYFLGGPNRPDEDTAGSLGDLVGEVFGQGTSPSARYASLATVAAALASQLRPVT